MAEENLVDIQLENLVFRQVVLDLVGEQRFVKFARVGLFGAQEEVACDLLGNGRGALTFATASQIGDGRAGDPGVVDPAVLIKPIIFGRQDGMLHDIRYVADSDDGATLLSKLANQVAIGGEDAQRYFGAIISQHFQRGQVRVGQHQNDQGNRDAHGDQPGDQQQRVEQKTKREGESGHGRSRVSDNVARIIRCRHAPP